jgi:phosphatidylglycerol---prolipoprotein diacylglyceryl transferase
MHPDLISLGPLTIRSYGTMIVMGFVLGLVLARLRMNRVSARWDQIMDLSFYLLLAGIGGAKILYWLIFHDQFLYEIQLLFSSPIEFFKSIGGGFVFFGSVIGGIVMLYFYTKKHTLHTLRILDFLIPSLVLGHACGRIGCFLAGCCYGKPCDLPWAVTFHHSHSLAPQNIPLHPTQIYESLFLFCLTAVLILGETWMNRIPGRLVGLYIITYSVWRVWIEHFRDDPRGLVFNGLMTSTQAVALSGIVVSAIFLIYLHCFRNSEQVNTGDSH